MTVKTTEKTKCDVKDCKNMASCYIPAKGKTGKFFLCDSCCELLYKQVVAAHTPKSPKNTIKRKIEEKEKETIV